MSSFVLNKQHLREVLIFFFNWKKSAAEAHRSLVEVYGESAPSDKSCREWFRRFKVEYSWSEGNAVRLVGSDWDSVL